MSWHEKTVETYNQSAAQLAEYFKGIGARTDDIELALSLANNPSAARVVEIGCGDGRDAAEIVTRVGWYEGFDPSEALLDLARQKVPTGNFVKADALTYDYPDNLDVVFAFASLLHVSRGDVPAVFQKIGRALRPGGIAFVSLKERSEYAEEAKADQFGERMFYYYSPALLKELAGTAFSAVFEDHQHIGSTDWFTLALQKNQ
ncbi:MAG TPA: class I SAM-dependent methyltransferase [Candidatus Saccharimonadales bacterium]